MDEQKLNEELPVFAAANLLRIPFLNADSLSVAEVVQTFDLFEQRLLALEQHSVLSCIAHNTQPEFSNMACSTDNGMEQTSGLELSRLGEEIDSHDSVIWRKNGVDRCKKCGLQRRARNSIKKIKK